MNICIDEARIGDVDALIVLLNELFSIEQDFTPDHAAQRRGLELLLAHPDQGRVFVARDSVQGVVGMVSVQMVISTAIGAPSAWVEDMVIQKPFRKLGLGKRLLGAACDWATAQGAGRIQLLADADNAPALDFYRHLEWLPTSLFAWKILVV